MSLRRRAGAIALMLMLAAGGTGVVASAASADDVHDPGWVQNAEPGGQPPAGGDQSGGGTQTPSDPNSGGPTENAPTSGDRAGRAERPNTLPATLAKVAAPTPALAWTARVRRTVNATARPGGGRVLARVGAATPYWGGADVLLVVARARMAHGTAYVRVRLKQMPAGSAGWVPAGDVTVAKTGRRIVVDLSARTVVFTRNGTAELRSSVVVGKPSTPTPTGLFAVDAPVAQKASNLLGPRVLALAAYSRALARYQGGIPQVAIHAYEQLGDPLGTASSHGCVRAPQSVVLRLIALAPRGTPVVIQR